MKQISFGEIAEFRNGLNFGKDSHGMGCLIIGIPDFKDRFYPDYSSLGEINPLGIIKEEDYLRKEDILFVRSNGNKDLVGRSLYIDKDIKAVYSGFCIRARLTSSVVDPLFCAYYTRSDRFKSSISTSGGTNIQNLNQGILANVKLPLFSSRSQKQIAKVLSDLDAKIEVNNKINKELEAMAKTLYDYWFVQFDFPFDFAQGIPDVNGKPYKSSGGKMVYNEELKREVPAGWEVNSFSDWIKNDKSGDWGKETKQGNYVNKVSCIRGADLNGLNGNGEVKSPTRFILEKNNHKLLEVGDFIIEISGGSPTQSTGRMAFIIEETLDRFENPLICSNFCKAVTLKDKNALYNFAYEWNRLYDAGVLFGWEGKTSGIKNLLFESFVTNHKVAIPDSKVMDLFYDYAKPIHAQIQTNLKENQKLAELRDWLLPMLMNGQVSVSEAEERLVHDSYREVAE
ncbi:restriction endonuclease subunit S [Brumimicrobium mesophilum]|uniref:restriction endonuclease subunit S n=1 Tax=Brumimicrobium mesophilum TaxID=392717 RepID=UPI001F1D3A98|nr:restriction endonuclease subunit S [Brumimicrobium mesophilum]